MANLNLACLSVDECMDNNLSPDNIPDLTDSNNWKEVKRKHRSRAQNFTRSTVKSSENARSERLGYQPRLHSVQQKSKNKVLIGKAKPNPTTCATNILHLVK
jgi:hypothetical protein